MATGTENEHEDAISKLSKEQAFENVKDIARIGNRWLGTPGEARAREYILKRFKKIGLTEVHTEPFDYLNYKLKSCHLEITHPVRRVLKCLPLEYSKNEDVQGEVVYAGRGTEAEFKELEEAGVDFRGKIVAVTSFAPFLFCDLCESREVSGVIVICESPKGYIGGFVGKFRPGSPFSQRVAKYPGVTTDAAGGTTLLRLLSTGRVKAKVSHDGVYSTKTSFNVVGSMPGVDEPEKKVIVGGHYDSQLKGPFAWDNGTGVSAVLEMARVLRGQRPRRTVVFISFSAEEIGLHGAAAYAKAHRSDLSKNGVAMVNLDALGSVFAPDNTIWATKNIEKVALSAAKEAGWEVRSVVDPGAFVFSDYYPFMVLGIPSTWIWEYPPMHPYYHSANDTLEFVDPDRLIKQIEVNARVAFHYAFAGAR